MTVSHFMVDFEGAAGDVRFANAAPLATLESAKALASKVSKTGPHGSASAVAFEAVGDGTFRAVGAVSFFEGRISDVSGVLA